MSYIKFEYFIRNEYDIKTGKTDTPVYTELYVPSTTPIIVEKSGKKGHTIISPVGHNQSYEVKGNPDAIMTKIEMELEPKAAQKTNTTKK